MEIKPLHAPSGLPSGSVLTAFVMLVVFLTMTLLALGFPPAARLMPLLAGVPGSVLAAICLVQEWRTAAGEAGREVSGRDRAERVMLAWTLAYFAGILALGFLYAVPVLVFLYLRFGARERVFTAVAGALATEAVLYGLFERGFAIPLFDGLVAAWLGA